MYTSPTPVITDEIKIVDSQGCPRIMMSARSGAPVIRLLQISGALSMEVSPDAGGHPAVKLANPDLRGPTAALAVDEKGTHVKSDRPGGASSYLFLNNVGESGVVFDDANGMRRLNILVGPDGDAKIERFGSDGKPLSYSQTLRTDRGNQVAQLVRSSCVEHPIVDQHVRGFLSFLRLWPPV